MAAAALLVLSWPSVADNARGAFQADVPIRTTPYHGLEPGLSIAYDSQRGNGPLGVGWSIKGLSRIVRLSATNGSPAFDDGDRFYLDGNELIACPQDPSSHYLRRAGCQYPTGGSGQAFVAQRETFERIVRTGPSLDAPWIVWDRAGTRRIYGAAADGASWHLARVEDVHGNGVDYRYAADTADEVELIRAISYNGTSITFHWEPRPDVLSTSNGRSIVQTKWRLSSVEVTADTHVARAYAISYTARPLSRFSSISAIQEFGRDTTLNAAGHVSGTSLPASSFHYDSDDASAFPAWTPSRRTLTLDRLQTDSPSPSRFSRTYLNSLSLDDCRNGGLSRFIPGDFDGDGRTEGAVVTACRGAGDAIVNINISQYGSHDQVRRGELDMAVENAFNDLYVDARSRQFDLLVADTNGDGRQDLVVLGWRTTTGDNNGPLELMLNTALSDGRGGFRWASSAMQPTGWITSRVDPVGGPQCAVGDYSGTKRSELACIFHEFAGAEYLGRAVSRRDGTLAPTQPTRLWDRPWGSSQSKTGMVASRLASGDINGDGLTDLMILAPRVDEISACPVVRDPDCVVHADLLTGLSDGTDFALNRLSSEWIFHGGTSGDATLLYSADVDGDGRADFVGLTERDGALETINTARQLRDGQAVFASQAAPAPPAVPASPSPRRMQVLLGDVDGDGATDLLVLSPVARGGGIGCTTGPDELVALTRVRSNADGSFALPARWDDCSFSATIPMKWNEFNPGLGSFRAADTNGDGLADFLLAYGRLGHDDQGHLIYQIAFADDVSGPRGVDPKRWSTTELNGDGRPDLVSVTASRSGTRVSQLVQDATGGFDASSFDLPAFDNSAVGTWRIADVDGDGRADLVHLECDASWLSPYGCDLRIDTFLGLQGGGFRQLGQATFGGFALLSAFDANLASWRVMDIDGQGRSSLVFVSTPRDGTGGLLVQAFSFETQWRNLGIAGPFRLGTAPPLRSALDDVLNWMTTDIDGDGRADLVHVIPNIDSNRVSTLRALGGNRWKLSDAVQANPPGFSWFHYPGVRSPARWHVGDANGDGLLDLYRTLPTSTGLLVQTLLSVGDGTWSEKTGLPDLSNAPEALRSTAEDNWIALRAGSGVPAQLVRVDRSQAGDQWIVTSLGPDAAGSWTTHRADMPDLPVTSTQVRQAWSGIVLDSAGRRGLMRIDLPVTSAMAIDVSGLALSNPDDLMQTAIHPSGGVTSVEHAFYAAYQPMAPGDGCMLPPGLDLRVAAAVTTSDGRRAGTKTTVSHDYGCPRWLPGMRRFDGWNELVTRTPATANQAEHRTQSIYAHTDACGPSLRASGPLDTLSRPIGWRLFVIPFQAMTDPWACLPAQIVRQTMERPIDLPVSSRLAFSYDAFGNATSILRRGVTDDGSVSSTTTLTYRPNTAAWIVSAPSTIEMRADGLPGGTLMRRRWYCYDDDATPDCAGAPTLGLIRRQIDLADAAHPEGRVTRYVYDEVGNLVTVRNANGHDSTITFDPNYRIYPMLYTDALGRVTGRMQWDMTLSLPRSLSAGNAAPTSTEYDVLGRVWRQQLPGGGRMVRDYLDTGDPERQSTRDTWIDGSGTDQWSRTFFDGLQRPYQWTRSGAEPFGHYARSAEYGDASERPSRSSSWYCASWWPFCTPHRGLQETFRYDALHRLERQIHPDATEVATTRRLEGVDLVTERTDETAVKSELRRDAFGRLSKVGGFVDGVKAQSRYLYDSADVIVATIDPMGNRASFVPNLAGEIVTVVDPDLGTVLFERDDMGQVKASQDAKGSRTIYTYDELERLKTKTLPDQRQLTFMYDEPGAGAALGRLTSLVDTSAVACSGNVTRRWTYDAAGLTAGMAMCVDGIVKTFSFGHDPMGRLHSVTYPDQQEVFYSYDAAGRVRGLSGVVDRIKYDAMDRPRRVRFANGMVSGYSYKSDRDALHSETTWVAGERTFDATYDYFDNLQLKSARSHTDVTRYTYSYDGLSRLSTVDGSTTADYHYDLGGNLTARSDLGSLSYPGQGPLGCSPDGVTARPCPTPHAVQNAGPFSLQYDANGAAWDVGRADGRHRSIEWDADHEPTQVIDFDGTVIGYAYDGMRHRVSRTKSGQTHRWFGGLAELNDSGDLIKHYYIGGRRVATADSGGMSWPIHDRMESVAAVVDRLGNVAGQPRFQPFGTTGSASAALQFAGQPLEPGLPLIFMGSRLYDPALGRFLSPDSIVPSLTQVQALNRYAYVYNNPLAYVDPSGHDPVGIYAAYQSDIDPDWYSGFVSLSVQLPSTTFSIAVDFAGPLTASPTAPPVTPPANLIVLQQVDGISLTPTVDGTADASQPTVWETLVDTFRKLPEMRRLTSQQRHAAVKAAFVRSGDSEDEAERNTNTVMNSARDVGVTIGAAGASGAAKLLGAASVGVTVSFGSTAERIVAGEVAAARTTLLNVLRQGGSRGVLIGPQAKAGTQLEVQLERALENEGDELVETLRKVLDQNPNLRAGLSSSARRALERLEKAERALQQWQRAGP